MPLNDFGGYSHKMSRVPDNTAIIVDITYVSHREGASEKQGNSDQLVTERETLKNQSNLSSHGSKSHYTRRACLHTPTQKDRE